mmetsp:Transcript_3574/g.9127  ORF Transcript_3574/g.9127 Transcript_3574/m.9127 type:complete len:104 (-) Transcript_3574:1875-2186(-)
MGRVGNLRRRKAPARSEGGDGEAEGDCSGSGGAGIGTSYGHHGHGHHDFPLHGDDTKGISQVEEVEDDDDDDAEVRCAKQNGQAIWAGISAQLAPLPYRSFDI